MFFSGLEEKQQKKTKNKTKHFSVVPKCEVRGQMEMAEKMSSKIK